MKLFLLMMLAIAQASTDVSRPVPENETAAPLSEVHKQSLSCVAAFAIVASEQERGVESALRYPLLAERGRIYAGQIGEKVMAETGQSREQVRDAILAAVSDQQTKAEYVAEPAEIIEAEMAKCLQLLEAELPAKPTPTLHQCAVLMQMAYEEVYQQEKLSKMAQVLKTLAFVLDSRAREQMRGEGKSGNESDIILTLIRGELEAKQSQQTGQTELDVDHCFTLAAPDKKAESFEH